MTVLPIKESEREELEERDDLSYQHKKISTWHVELFTAEGSGGHINIWEKGESTLEHVWTPATIEGEDYKQATEVHFWDAPNAQAEYDALDTVEDITNLMWRNR